MEQVSPIQNHLYVGTIAAAQNEQLMKNLNISLIVNCTENAYTLEDKSIEVIQHNVKSKGFIPLKDYYEPINKKIDSYITKDKNVLIHCFYGATRSCSCAIAYFIWKNHWTYNESFALVSTKRTVCEIPSDFEMILREYESQFLYGIRHENIDSVNYMSLIEIVIDDSTEPEYVLAQMMRYSDLNKDIRIGTHKTQSGHYGSKTMSFEALLDDKMDDDTLEKDLYSYLGENNVLSIRVKHLEE